MSSKQNSRSGKPTPAEVFKPKLDENGKEIPLTDEEKENLIEEANQTEPVAPT